MAEPLTADEVRIARLVEQFAAHRDEARATSMAAYMRDQFSFVGLPAGERRRLARAAFAGTDDLDQDQLVAFAWSCWARPEREYQYVAGDEIARLLPRCTSSLLADLEALITTKSWWDTVDGLCRHGAGALVRADRALESEMDRWLASDNVWLIRSAILHQERWGAETDPDRLFSRCLQRADHRDFFVRKAIGWALRSYAHVDQTAVRQFLIAHDRDLSGLSKREALARIKEDDA